MRYCPVMAKHSHPVGRGLTLDEAKHLQALEGNPLDAEQIAMFEMFDREGWSAAKRRTYVLNRLRRELAAPAAE